VKIVLNGQVVEANVVGRKEKFAQVWTKAHPIGWQYSWSAIVRSLNDDRPLKPEI
jgi:hypothetical protein